MSKSNKKFSTFNIIKHRGSLDVVETIWGWKAFRQKSLFVSGIIINGKEFNGFVPCLPYDNHFIYEVPDSPDTVGVPAYMCTCGSFAVIIGSNVYNKDMSSKGLYLACYSRNGYVNPETGELYGRHADGSI